jgi:putative NADH-flavin reductase
VKLLVLGGTGGTGRQVVQQALDAGHIVTVLVRDPKKNTIARANLRIITGELEAPQALGDAMRGQDAVISAIGRGKSFKSQHLIERSVARILDAMATAKVRRLIFTSALGVGATFAESPPLAKLFFVTLLRGIYADKLVGDRMIRNSGVDWTIVQPTVLNDGALTKTYRSGEHLALSGMPSISRADSAHFMLDCLNTPSTIRKTLIVTS